MAGTGARMGEQGAGMAGMGAGPAEEGWAAQSCLLSYSKAAHLS